MDEAAWLHLLSVVLLGLAGFSAFHNLCFAVNGQPKLLRGYLAVKGLFALVLVVIYVGDLVGLWDPSAPHTVGRSLLTVTMFMLCTDVLLRQSPSRACESLERLLIRCLRRGKEGSNDAA